MMVKMTWASAVLAACASAYQNQAASSYVDSLDLGHEERIKHQYLKFVATYGKSYATMQHMDERFSIFKENYLKIAQHNNSVDEHGRQAPFKMGVNRFSDMSEAEFVQQRLSSAGVRPHDSKARRRKKLRSIKQLDRDGHPIPEREEQEEDSIDPMLALKKPHDGPLPRQKSWYAEGLVTHPHDQGACGACWAFSAASTLETLAMITGTEPSGKLIPYSVQQLMDCDDTNFVCAGGWMYEAYEYVAKNGILLEQNYAPFKAHKGSCDTSQVKKKWHFKNVGQEEKDGMTNEEMKRRIMKQPLGVAIYAPGILMSYSSGVITEAYLHCSRDSYDVNHGVVVVGFGTVEGHEKVHGLCNEYWIVRNSWGKDWGEEGTFKLCMDGSFSDNQPLGICHINEFGTWPTMYETTDDDDQM